MFFGWRRRRITSRTDVFRTDIPSWSVVNGVYPVIRKCRRGVGINGAIRPTRSLFMYEGYLKVVVLTDMIVETNLLICVKLGFWM